MTSDPHQDASITAPQILGYAGPTSGLLRDNSALARWTIGLLVASIAFTLLNVPLQIIQWRTFDPVETSQAFRAGLVAGTTGARQGAATQPATAPAVPVTFQQQTRGQMVLSLVQTLYGLTFLVVWVAGVVLYLIWQYRAASNVQLLGGETTFGPGLGVVLWLIPVVNLVTAGLVLRGLFQGAKQVAQATDYEEVRWSPVWLIWLLWVIYWVLMGIAMAFSFSAIFTGQRSQYDLAMVLGLVNTAVLIAFYGLLVVFIRKVQRTPAGGGAI